MKGDGTPGGESVNPDRDMRMKKIYQGQLEGRWEVWAQCMEVLESQASYQSFTWGWGGLLIKVMM
jgi:hypothetical protein